LAYPFDSSVFRVHASAAEVRDARVFELYPGDFAASVTRWNPGSVYIRATGFAPFATLIVAVAPTFRWRGATRLRRPQLEALREALERLSHRLVYARTAEDLLSAVPKTEVPEEHVALARAQLIRSIEGVSDVAWRASCRPGALWVIGP
jgi:hypothetical protein